MKEIFDLTQNKEEKEKYAAEILDLEYYDYDWAIKDVTKTVLNGDFPEKLKEKAALTLFNNRLMTLEDRKDKQLMAWLEAALRDDDDDDDDNDDGMFVCACCHERIPIDEIDDPEREICDECYYSGRCIEMGESEEEDDEEFAEDGDNNRE